MRIAILATLILTAGISGYAQAPSPTPCENDCVTISRQAAVTAVENARKVDALEALIIVKDKAIDDLKIELNKMRIEFAEKAGENTALKQNAISDRAIITVLLQSIKRKCLPLSICIAN